MKKTLSLITATLILASALLSSCVNQPEAPMAKNDYSSNNSDLVITEDGTTIFLSDTGKAYGLGENREFSLGVGHNNKVETAVRIPIEEAIAKISVQDNNVYYFAESGSVYRTGEKAYPEKLDLSDIKEKAVDISEGLKNVYLLIDSNKVYKRNEIGYGFAETLEFPEKVIEIQCSRTTEETNWFLTENGKLYMTGGFGITKEEKPVLKAENIADLIVCGDKVYCLNTAGEVFGTGVFANESAEIRAGFTEATVGDKVKKDKDSLWLYTDEFWKLDIKEPVKFLLKYGSAAAFIASSGRVYVVGDEGVCPLGRTENRGVYRTELFINNIDNIDKIVTSGGSHSGGRQNYTHAVKRFGEEWVFAAKNREEISIKNVGFGEKISDEFELVIEETIKTAEVGSEILSAEDTEIYPFGDNILFLSDGNVYGVGENNFYELGLGHNKKVEKVVQIPIEERVEKICPLTATVAFVTESGKVFLTGRHLSVSEIPPDEYYHTPYELEISPTEKVVDITGADGLANYRYITESGEMNTYDYLKRISSPTENVAKFVSVKHSTFAAWALDENSNLYQYGSFYDVMLNHPKGVNKVAENVIAYWTEGNNAYCINQNGELFGIGRVKEQRKGETYLGIDVNKYASKIKENGVYDDVLYVNEFCKIDIPEKVSGYLQFGNLWNGAMAVIGESGKVYVWGDYSVLPNTLKPEGDTDKRYPVFSGYTILNYDKIEKINSNKDRSMNVTYAAKYQDGWTICVNDDRWGVETGVPVKAEDFDIWK